MSREVDLSKFKLKLLLFQWIFFLDSIDRYIVWFHSDNAVNLFSSFTGIQFLREKTDFQAFFESVELENF